jgi:hypothetical protein
MTEKTKGKQLDFKGDGVAVWQNVSKDGTKTYLTIKLVGHETVYAWVNEKN